VAILSMDNPDLIYVAANPEEDRLRGVAPGTPVELQLDASAQPFHSRVVWIDKSTGGPVRPHAADRLGQSRSPVR
jgi:multidrug resistance efflux pump